MTVPPPSADDVLAANDAFYRAFAQGDFEAMDGLWSRDAPVSCLHPGWSIVVGRRQVMASWRAILGNPPPIGCRDAHVLAFDHMTLIVCVEVIGEATLSASNLYVREGAVWRMVHHQACPSAGQTTDASAEDTPPRALH